MSRLSTIATRGSVGLLAAVGGSWLLWQAYLSPDELLGEMTRNSLRLVLVTLAIALPLGTLLAALVFRTDLPAARVWRVLLILPLFIPLPVYAGLWKASLGTRGLLAGLAGGGWDGGLVPAAVTHAAAALPWVVLIVGLGLRSVEPELEEAALLDAGPLRVFLCVTLRRGRGSILTAALLVGTLVAGEMTLTDLFQQYRTYAEEVYLYFSTQGAASPAVLAGVPGVGLLAVLLAFALTIILRHDPRQWETLWRGCMIYRLGRWRPVAAMLLAIVVAATLGTLLWILVARIGMYSRRVVPPPGATATGPDYVRSWSAGMALQTLGRAAGSQRRSEWLGSMLRCALAGTLASGLAVPVAWLVHRRRWAIPGMGALMGVSLAVPGPVLALGLILAFNRPGLLGHIYDSTAMLVLGLVLRVWPFVFLAVWAPIRILPLSLLEAASASGAGGWQAFYRIQVPLSRAPALLGLLTGFALSLGELPVSVLLQQPGRMPLSVQIFSLLHSGVYNEVAAITLLLVGFMSLLLIGMQWTVRRIGRRTIER